MTDPKRMTTFATQLTVNHLPPQVEVIQAALVRQYPAPSRIVHWAIVKADPTTNTLWLEGSLTES